MKTYEVNTLSPEETMELAQRLGELVWAGTILTLEGDLGAGKTHFTKGLAKGLDVKRTVSSPTFTIIKEYKGRLPLYHMDVYRVGDGDEELGLDEYFYGEGVTVVEWASLIKQQLPSEHLEIEITHQGEFGRKIIFIPKGEAYILLCKGLLSK
ncbi:tRNA (adenosine(37)-N6)-threonylcarbamoyltransferase complex ATPase subunit type 1 TsaE [Bacillaceae bacterium IKA-2]|nr:tRNA (adenosine(37)-N6)-threonylcarbamoyltransferase complex ATPase subunit type 1 TsaE [Bacillaceae bacterium IKA-2]